MRADTPLNAPAQTSESEINRDLGFGSVVSRDSRQRLLNRDGSFNVKRTGLRFWYSLSLYHWLLTMGWGRFLSLLTLSFLCVNAIFAAAYVMCGPGALANVSTDHGQFYYYLQAFFFSVHTFGTIGYGNVTPTGLAANFIVVAEAMIGLLGVALATGLIFARFSRPTAKILFSKHAVIAPYRGGAALMFRISNARSNQIVELHANVMYTRFEAENGRSLRRFYPLTLERNRVVFFPLAWTVVHPINESSPLWGYTPEMLINESAEFLIMLTGFDETFSQTVHTRSSYIAEDIVWNAKFGNIYNYSADGTEPLSIDIGRLHSIEPTEPVMPVNKQFIN
ncbi:MAG TPA: ion channel [Blastocatellia bacterium]|nr:ion channel [Blastocatellia bacterium]